MDFEELVKNNKFSSSFDAKTLYRRFRKVKTVIHVDCLYTRDNVTMTTEDVARDTLSLYKAMVERNAAIPILDWISRGHVILDTLLKSGNIDDALRLAQCFHTIISSLHQEHGGNWLRCSLFLIMTLRHAILAMENTKKR